MAARALGVQPLVPDPGCTAVFPRVWGVFAAVGPGCPERWEAPHARCWRPGYLWRPTPAGSHKCCNGGVLLPDGRVVLVPSNAATIGLYDPATNTMTVGPNVGMGPGKYIGGVLLPDGRVVLVLSSPGSASAALLDQKLTCLPHSLTRPDV